MKKSCLVIVLALFCVLVLGVAGCGGEGTWTNLNPTGDLPSARWASMVYDSASAKVILFGGDALEGSHDTVYGDTWAYDPAANTWTNLNPAGDVPSARYNHSMTYNSAGGRVILFGGRDGSTEFTDTWAYDPAANTWTNLKPAGSLPPAGGNFRTVYDSTSDKVILFGGVAGEGNSGTVYNYTWAYDPAANTWTNLNPGGDLPPARMGASVAYDSDADKVILFGGVDDSRVTTLADTWAYDPTANRWTNLNPGGDLPRARMGASMVYDSTSGRVILFGGLAQEGYGNHPDTFCRDTWAYDPTANRWTNLNPGGDLPPAAEYPMVYDSTSGQVILFGGWARSIEFNDTWAYSIKP